MLKVIPLGGLGEIGLNMMVLEYNDYILVLDAGLMFPDEYMPGVDIVIPDFQYLKENSENVKSVVLTHGHEDHIGAMPFLLKEFSVPVFGSNFTIELLKQRLKEHNLNQVDFRKIKPGDTSSLGPFEVEYIAVNHSIVEGMGLSINTPEGLVLHSGDFKIDPTPTENQSTDLERFAQLGDLGVLAFFSDSTNAEKEGTTLSERDVSKTLEDIFQSSAGRIIVAAFASNISRIQEVIKLSLKFGRKVLFNGKSMISNVAIAKQEGFLSLDSDAEINERQIKQWPDGRVAIITTGSQGEPMSALSRMAQDKHKSIKIKAGDTIILSSRFIPGNERAITRIINSLYRKGAEVIYEKVSDIHTSGHAKKEELRQMLKLVRPKHFIPIHGEYRHLVKHKQIAMNVGIPEENILVAEDGDIICFDSGKAYLDGSVKAGKVFVDGKGVGDVGDLVLRDRRRLSEHGMVVALLCIDETSGDIVYGPDITSRGFVFEDAGQHILDEARRIVSEAVQEFERPPIVDWGDLGSDVERRLKRFFYNAIERRPLILPIIIPM
jgi:ribonuclease J